MVIKNIIMYVDFNGKERVLPLDKEIDGVNFDEIVSFTRINQEVKNGNGVSTIERYVVGIPYKYAAIDSHVVGVPMYPNIKEVYCYDKKHLINDILNNGRQVDDEEANCCYEMLTGNICYKTSNVHVVSSQNELLRILMEFIKENEQTIGTQQKPASRVRK